MTLLEQWEATADEPIRVTKKDGTQLVINPDGTKEVILEDDERYDHWVKL